MSANKRVLYVGGLAEEVDEKVLQVSKLGLLSKHSKPGKVSLMCTIWNNMAVSFFTEYFHSLW